MSDKKEMVERRIERLCSHLGAQSITEDYQLAMASCAKVVVKFPVSSVVLADYMKGKHRCLQEKILQYFRDQPELQVPIEISKDEHRELTMRQLQGLVREAGIRPLKSLLEDPSQYFAITEAAGTVDLSLAIKLGVQFRFVSFIDEPNMFLIWIFLSLQMSTLTLYVNTRIKAIMNRT